MYRLLIVFAFLTTSGFGSLMNVYVQDNTAAATIESQRAALDGSSCDKAYPIAWTNTSTNWGKAGTQIGVGSTVHLCGTINMPAGAAGLIVQGSGTATQPITILFEPNAILQSPVFGGQVNCYSASTCLAAISIVLHNFIIIDGGTNGIIQNTANGTNLAYQQTSVGVDAYGSNIIIRNLKIQNIYINDPASTSTAGASTADIAIPRGSTNVTVCNSTLNNSRYGISVNGNGGAPPSWPLPSCSSNSFPTGFNVFGNTLVDHAWFITPGGLDNEIVNLFNNDISNDLNWVTAADTYHTDGILADSADSTEIVLYLFNNYFHDGLFGTAQAYCTYYAALGGCRMYAFNNVMTYPLTGTTHGGEVLGNRGISLYVGAGTTNPTQEGTSYFYNNTFANGGHSIEIASDGDYGAIANNLVAGNGVSTNGFLFNNYGLHTLPQALAACDYNLLWNLNKTPYTSNVAMNGAKAWNLATWHSISGFDAHTVTGNPNLNSSYIPQTGSPAIGAGKNLTSLCQSTPGLTALCFDKNGKPRPSIGAWDIGAYETTAVYTISVATNSLGRIMSSDGIVDCGEACSINVRSGESVTLTALPIARASFLSWDGAASVCAGNPCILSNVTANRTVKANFSTPKTAK